MSVNQETCIATKVDVSFHCCRLFILTMWLSGSVVSALGIQTR